MIELIRGQLAWVESMTMTDSMTDSSARQEKPHAYTVGGPGCVLGAIFGTSTNDIYLNIANLKLRNSPGPARDVK
jgi:hypothetical protein